MSMLHSVDEASAERSNWMSVMARAPLELLEAWRAQRGEVAFTWLRAPETGLVMLRARAGGSGAQFNLTNEMVFAMLFVVAVGLGLFAGVLALWVHTTGTLSKLFSEAVEAIDPQPVEGIRATGAHPLEEIAYGVIPQVLPLWISYSLYRFEANVRSASVVGMVGAGGIGVVLWEIIRGFYYAETCAVLLIIIVTVTAIDFASARIRKLFI